MGVGSNGFQVQLPYRGNKYLGSHAVVLVGYDDAAECFVLKNSWGAPWGKKGKALIPYDYISQYATELVAVGGLGTY